MSKIKNWFNNLSFVKIFKKNNDLRKATEATSNHIVSRLVIGLMWRIIAVLIAYVTVVTIGLGLVPMTVTYISALAGITSDVDIYHVICLWLFPSVFVVGFYLYETCVFIKSEIKFVHRLADKWINKIIK